MTLIVTAVFSSSVYSSSLEKEIREDEQRLKVKDGVMKEYHEKSDEKVLSGVHSGREGR